MDRRRLTGLAAIVVAGFASLATSPPIPSPPPSVDQSTSGSAHLSTETPVVVRELGIRFNRPATIGRTPTVTFSHDALLEASGGNADVRLSIIAAGATDPGDPFRSFGAASGGEPFPRTWSLACDSKVCEGSFALLVEWLDPAARNTVDVDWNVKAHIEFWTGPDEVLPAVEFTATEVEPGVAAGLTAATASNTEAARLDAENRLALWRVSMALGEGPLATAPAWPLVVTARLVPRSTTVNPPATGEAVPARVFIEGGDASTSGGFTATQPGDTIEFRPFWSCVADEPCKADYVVGLRMSDGRPEVALDAGWNLELRAVAVDGVKVPVALSVEAVPPMPMARATTSGTMILGREPGHSFRYAVTEAAAALGDGQWRGLPLPTFGIARARMTWTGSTPVPPGFFVTFGPVGSPSTHLSFDEETALAFAPSETCRVDSCELTGDLYSSAGGGSGAFPKDWGVKIDWALEVGMGTTAADGNSKLTITEVTQP